MALPHRLWWWRNAESEPSLARGQQFGGDSVAIEEDVWHHVASVFPEGGTEGDDVIHYVDGVFEPKLGGTSPIINTGIDLDNGALPVHIGFRSAPCWTLFQRADFADVRIYDEGLEQADNHRHHARGGRFAAWGRAHDAPGGWKRYHWLRAC